MSATWIREQKNNQHTDVDHRLANKRNDKNGNSQHVQTQSEHAQQVSNRKQRDLIYLF